MTKEKAPAPSWNSFKDEEYSDAIAKMVHQSFKQVNTNADAGGVRISTDRAMQSRYICVRSLMARGIEAPLERITGAATNKIYSNIRDIENGVAEGAKRKEQKFVRQELKSIRATDMTVGDRISPRLRQILLPKDGGYIAVTPMSSVGLCVLFDNARRAHHELIKNKALPEGKYHFVRVAEMPVGGANPANIGTHAVRLQQIIMSSFPIANVSIKRVNAVHHRGPRMMFTRELISAYFGWRSGAKWAFDNRMEDRATHKAFMTRFVSEAYARGADAFEMLTNYKAKLPKDKDGNPKLFSEHVPVVLHGFVLREARTADWKREAAAYLGRTIRHKTESSEGQTVVSQDEFNAMVSLLEDLL